MTKIRFNEVFVADAFASTLFNLGYKEGLLYTKPGEDFPFHSPSPKARQSALSLIILFDKLVIHDTNFDSCYRFPDLERDGIVEFVVAPEPVSKPKPIFSSWKPKDNDKRSKPPVKLRQSLSLIQEYKPLIIERLMSVRAKDFDSNISNMLKISRRVYYNELLDLAIFYATGNEKAINKNILNNKLPEDLLEQIKKEFFDYSYRDNEKLAPTNATLLISTIYANELASIQEISSDRSLGVASAYYTPKNISSIKTILWTVF